MPTIAVGMTWCAALALGAQVDAPASAIYVEGVHEQRAVVRGEPVHECAGGDARLAAHGASCLVQG